jgi:hypothetical protein
MTETPTSGTADKSSTSTCRDSTERRARVARRLSRQREKIKARGLHAQMLVARDTIAYEVNRRRKKHPGKQVRMIRELRALIAAALAELAAEREAASRTANRGRRRNNNKERGKLNPSRAVAASRASCR